MIGDSQMIQMSYHTTRYCATHVLRKQTEQIELSKSPDEVYRK